MSKLSKRYQLTIPKKFIIALGLKPGDKVEFSVGEGSLFMWKSP